jgi:hypothetical protein
MESSPYSYTSCEREGVDFTGCKLVLEDMKPIKNARDLGNFNTRRGLNQQRAIRPSRIRPRS